MLSLPLRQQKILQILQSRTSYITGAELGRQLGVSSRTIRTDITELNQSLVSLNAQVLSVKSKGYLLSAADMELLVNWVREDSAFLTREDRVRYLAFQLCLCDTPISLYDLEDEMAVSHTTLDHDLRHLKFRFVQSAPHICLYQQKEEISFERNERKRREILNRLFREDWDYDSKGNAYYGYEFLDEDILEIIMKEVPVHLRHFNLAMEDSSLVTLNLALSIMYHRIRSGHLLPDAPPAPKPDSAAQGAVQDMMDALEAKLKCTFRPEERDDIYQLVASSHLLDASLLTFETVYRYFTDLTIEMANDYLKNIRDVFHLDFFNDEDFYITLLQYIRSLQAPIQTWNAQGNPDITKGKLAVEYEFAHLFQLTAQKYLGYYLHSAELLYLAYCISGALEYYYHHHPEYKIRTVLCGHLNLAGVWSLKRKVLGAFANYIDVIALFPINSRSAYDYSDTELILTTTRKEFPSAEHVDVLRISTFMDSTDLLRIQHYISSRRMEHLYPNPSVSLASLLENAFWHERNGFPSRFAAIEYLAQDFIKEGIVGDDFIADILRRESICPFARCPGILLLHSLVPASETRLSIAVLNHRMIWNRYKFRLIVMAAFTPKDATLVFALTRSFYETYYDAEAIRLLRTKEAVMEYYQGDPVM